MSEEAGHRLQLGAYFMLAGGFVLSALAQMARAKDKQSLGSLGDAGSPGKVKALPSARLPTSLPAGDAKKPGKPKLKQYDIKDIDQRVGLIGELIRKGSLSPDLRERTVELLAQKCDALGRVSASGTKWCLPAGTLLLRKPYDLVRIEDVRVGDIIMGDGKWVEVLAAFDTGVKPLLEFHLNNGTTFRCTEEHKLFVVPRRRRNGTVIGRDERSPKMTFPGKREDAIEVRAGDVREGDELLQPERLPFGTSQHSADWSFLYGAFAAEGWTEPSRLSIAGVPNGKGIREEAVQVMERLQLPFVTDNFKVRVNSPEWAAHFAAACGVLAANKRIPSLDLQEEAVRAAIRGLNADARTTARSNVKSDTFVTTSETLALQYRLLNRMLGRSASVGLDARDGTHVIHVRQENKTRGSKSWARVQAVHKVAAGRTFDLEVETNRIYLPSADVVVHNCVPEKDCLAEVKWIFNAIRFPGSKYAVRYTRDAMLADVFTAPERTLLKSHGGDCFVKGTKVLLREGHKLVPIETLREGDEVWGYNSWTKVTKLWGDKGILPTWLIRLNNGSTMRLTPDHKVWVADRLPQAERHTQSDAHVPMSQQVTNLRRIYVRDLKKGDIVLSPDRVDYGTGSMDSDRALVEGLYLSDGWCDENRFCVSGKDGHPKEAQKLAVKEVCERLGITTSTHERYIRVQDAAWTERLKQMGTHASQKRALSIDLEQAAADKLLIGIMADAGLNSNGKTVTFTTTSRDLWLQTRVLLKQQGVSCSERFIADHGGLGRNLIHRLQTRVPYFARPVDMKAEKLLAVKEVVQDNLALPCFDIETEDHFVWLPEADWTTSQCDDYVIVLGSMLMAVGHPVRLRVIATRRDDTPDDKAPWSHIYLLTPTTFDNPNAKWVPMWVSVDGSMDKPLGWEAPGAADVAKSGKPAGIVARVRDYSLLRPSDGV